MAMVAIKKLKWRPLNLTWVRIIFFQISSLIKFNNEDFIQFSLSVNEGNGCTVVVI